MRIRRKIKAVEHWRVVLVASIAGSVTWLGGCLTYMAWDPDFSYAHGPAFRISVASAEMPRPRIAWLDLPIPARGLLTLEPDLPGCERVHFYAPDEYHRYRRVEGRTFRTPATTRIGRDGIADRSERVPKDRCGIWITSSVSPRGDAQSYTLTFSTRAGPFRTMDLRVGEQVPSELKSPSTAFKLLVLPPIDLVLTPVAAPVFLYAGLRPSTPREDGPIRVRFTFPDGSEREVTVARSDFPKLRASDPLEFGRWLGRSEYPCEGSRCWIRAAVLKLGMDFREEPRSLGPIRRGTAISMLDGQEGPWAIRLHGTRVVQEDLDQELGLAHTIYVSTF